MKFLILLMLFLTGCADYKTGRQAYRDKNYESAKENLEPLAFTYGHTKSQVELANLYLQTEPAETHGVKVRGLLQRAIIEEEGKAYYLQGRTYEEGYGVPVDGVRAASLYQKASDTGYWRAKYYLARLFDRGQVVPQDRAQAIQYYREILEERDYDTARKALIKAQEKMKKEGV